MKFFIQQLLLAPFLYGAILFGYPFQKNLEKRIVSVPVANVMRKPGPAIVNVHSPVIHRKDILGLYTQALMGEQLEVVNKNGDWLEVRLLEQLSSSFGGKLQPILGWIEKSHTCLVAEPLNPLVVTKGKLIPVYEQPDITCTCLINLSYGTQLEAVKHNKDWWLVRLCNGMNGFVQNMFINQLGIKKQEQALRDDVVAVAKNMIGSPFCWFGRSSYDEDDKHQLTSLGCDGFINLVYRSCGLVIPRFVYDQYVFGEPIDGNQVQPGDLIFYGIPNRSMLFKPNHTMMYIGDGNLIEATFQSPAPIHPLRTISCKKRLGKELSEIKNGELSSNGRYVVCFCRFITSK